MNVVFLTQSSTLRVFNDLENAMAELTPISAKGYYVADSQYYFKFLKNNPTFNQGRSVTKEWEILKRAISNPLSNSNISTLEEKYGDPTLWNAIVADRRLYLGERGTFHEDFFSRYTHEQLKAILSVGIEEIEKLFDEVRPDVVISFICVTIGEYLAYLVAKKRGVLFVNLRPTRIKNFFFAGESIHEPSERLRDRFRDYVNGNGDHEYLNMARTVIQSIRNNNAMYEGVLPAEKNAKVQLSSNSKTVNPLTRSLSFFQKLRDYKFGDLRFDNHFRGLLYPLYYNKLLKPLRAAQLDQIAQKSGVTLNSLRNQEFLFFPLHKEPEVTLLVYSRPYLNQLEAIRLLARSIPVGMKVLVKEHPAGVGYHPVSFYKAISKIPNVILVPTAIPSRKLVEAARLIAIISGSAGLESLMLKKPVIALGNTPFSWLPNSMIRTNKNPYELASDISMLLKEHRHDESSLENFVAATADSSVPVDFYSVLIGREGVVTTASSGSIAEKRQENLSRLAKYLIELEREKNAF